jgi:F0F1-type ATP synthase assembly protein I
LDPRRQQTPLSLARLGGAGFALIANVIVGGLLGAAAYKYLHWDWAVPVGILVGFVSGFYSMFRQLSNM